MGRGGGEVRSPRQPGWLRYGRWRERWWSCAARCRRAIIDAIASSEGGPFAFAVTTSVDDLPARFFLVPATKVIRADDGEVEPGSGENAIPGDLAEVEADGAIRFLGRGSGVINTGGEKVHPQEVENVLLTHQDITDAVVVGIPDETWGERVAALVATANTALTEEEVQDWVRQRLAGYKVPRGVVLLPELPRTPTGKLELAWARKTAQQRLADVS